MTPDAALVRRCLDGDHAAWSELLTRYADLVHGVLRRGGLGTADAADGFQEVSVLLWKNLRRLRDVERLLPWVVTTSKRVGWRLRKRSKARAERETSVARAEETDEAPDLALAVLEEEQAVRESLTALAERCRRLLRALYFAPGAASYDEIAAQLGIPRGSIGPTRQRCLEALQRELEVRGLGPGGVSTGPSKGSDPRRRRARRTPDSPRGAS